MQASELSETEICYCCQWPTQMIGIGVKELIQSHDTNVVWA